MRNATSQLPRPQADWALFLDFDGTLVELADHPERVAVPPEVPDLLGRLAGCLQGAVAIVSGRSLAGLERLLDGAPLAMAGVHGLERRDASGRLHRPVDHTESFREARAAVARFVDAHPGTHWEDKGNAVTLHYRGAPQAAEAAARFLQARCRELGEEFAVQHGKQVLELKPTSHHKGTVVASFLAEPPFAGRCPVFIGDDVTDEDAFRVANERNGHSIRVGGDADTAARYRVGSVKEVLEWLNSLPQQLGQCP